MDKNNYNVDDILSEIKARKRRSKSVVRDSPESTSPPQAGAPYAAQEPPKRPAPKKKPPRPMTPEYTENAAGEPARAPRASQVNPGGTRNASAMPENMPPPSRAKVQPPAEPARPRAVVKEPAHLPSESRPFKVTIPDDTQPEQAKNPLEFGESVQSIGERARRRNADGTKRLPKFHFNPGTEAEPDASSDTGRTRLLPNVPARPNAQKPQSPAPRRASYAKAANDGYYDDYESAEVHSSPIDYSEYNSTSDKHDVQTDIAKVKLWLFIRIAATFILAIVLFMFTIWGKYEIPLLPSALEPVPETMRAYMIACTVIAILIALVNSSAVGGGLIGLFRLQANSDTLPACAVLAAVGQGVVGTLNPDAVDPSKFNLYFIAAAVIMLFNGFGKILMVNRIMSNFRTISSDIPKKALLNVRSDDFCHEFFKSEVRRPAIAYCVKSGFLTDFLGLSYSDRYDVGINRIVAPACLGASVVVGILTYFLAGSAISAISSLAAVLCICATLSSTFIENVPLGGLAKKLEPMGGMVSGIKAVDGFCDTKAVVLTENDLFPAGNVTVSGIKAFSQRIDEAIVDAASVLCAMDGALGFVFLDMIGGNRKLLKQVDNIVFENDMGVSAWVDGRRVLIGNRKLMMNHGIALPGEAAVQKPGQLSHDSEPLFLSSSGEASAQFSVSYRIDEDLAVELDHFGTLGRLLIVYTTDANITAEKIWELYGYPLELIRVLPSEMHPAYQDMSKPRDKAPAQIAYTGNAAAIVKAIVSCISVKSSIVLATVIQLSGVVLGYAFVTYMAFMGTISALNVMGIIAYQLFWFAAIFIVQKVRQT